MSTETMPIPREAEEPAVSFAGAGALIVGVFWTLSALVSFATIGLDLGIAAAIGWAIVVGVASFVCIGSLVGIIAWPFVVAIVSAIFGAPPPGQWEAPASLVSLFIAYIVSIVVGVVIGGGLGYVIGGVVGQFRRE